MRTALRCVRRSSPAEALHSWLRSCVGVRPDPLLHLAVVGAVGPLAHTMSSTRRILKPIDQLRVRDLSAHPVWRFALDAEDLSGQNETSVEPVGCETLPLEQPDALFVAADFSGADGGSYVGVVQVTSGGELTLEPCALVTSRAYAPLPQGPMANSVKRFAEGVLGMPLDPLYPLTFTLRVRVEGESGLRSGHVSQSWTET